MGVMFVCFIKDGNLDMSKDLLSSQNKNSVNTLAFCLMIFVGISELWIAFKLSRFKISF